MDNLKNIRNSVSVFLDFILGELYDSRDINAKSANQTKIACYFVFLCYEICDGRAIFLKILLNVSYCTYLNQKKKIGKLKTISVCICAQKKLN